MDHPTKPSRAWQDIYDATLQETNILKLFALVETAEATILMRRDALKNTADNESELSALETALQTLFVIKQERLKFFPLPQPIP